jgi:hypothetical protein
MLIVTYETARGQVPESHKPAGRMVFSVIDRTIALNSLCYSVSALSVSREL